MSISFFIAINFLALSRFYFFLFVVGLPMLVFYPLFAYFVIKSRRKIPKEELEQIKMELKKYKKKVIVYRIIGSVSSIIGIVLFFTNIIFFPNLITLLGIAVIVEGLNFKHNKEYFKIVGFRAHGDDVERQIAKMYKIFILLGLTLILLSIYIANLI